MAETTVNFKVFSSHQLHFRLKSMCFKIRHYLYANRQTAQKPTLS